ncbi:UDP-glucose 6-dehydrogenase (UDP-Glc dehydrogenas e) (UDP-GlcDH) (UDPGDH) [Streptococcus gallolyticus]|uniref:UDP-glucose 6-dehydrogenase (UDP-Glc dehydrogenas e) (UDP-GlcDH) (UDPGDH) n=1 Tax=Streptococcus gallolyticus TaxID=315405 RepID=A0A060RKD0_9STRE|nr:NAD-binding protein [Streptococcus gallolyticus]CDO17889.1 UDP-glucose 6-dehydrogenase (UDP-Glc dehydrogenas e) (UDP-GlcDH) (UDPGDH) [Streptococcus gallolyticus]
MKKIVVVGCGYVGLSISVLLAQNHMVTVVDKDPDKVEKINAGISTIKDDYIESYLSSQPLYLSATLNGKTVYKDADYVVIATPTNYDSELGHFDCSSVESVVEEVFSVSDEAVIVIKSTIPVGYTEELRQKFETNRILFSPEFLRESKALYDNLYPNRLIISCDQESMHWAKEFLQFLKDASLKPDVPMLLADFSEAEAIKLFANTYLALRVAFFNELDTYAEARQTHEENIVFRKR